MPEVTPEDAVLILNHVLGYRSVPDLDAKRVLVALRFPSDPTPRLRRGILLRRLAADPVSKTSLDTLQLLASLPLASPTPIAAVHIRVAALLAVRAPDFGAAAKALFAYPNGRARRAIEEGGSPALASDAAIALADQFEAYVGNSFGETTLRSLWGDRSATEERLSELLDAEWAAIGPSLLEAVAERILQTWRTADEATRANFLYWAGEGNTSEILSKLEELTSSANPISTPVVEKVIDVLKTSCADLHSVVEDSLPDATTIADEVVIAMLEKGFGSVTGV